MTVIKKHTKKQMSSYKLGESLMESSTSASPDCSAATPPRSGGEDGCDGSASHSVRQEGGEECAAGHSNQILDHPPGAGGGATSITVVCNGRIIKQEDEEDEEEDDGVEEDGDEDETPERSSHVSASSASDGGFVSSPGLSRER